MQNKKYKIGDIIVDEYCSNEVPKEMVIHDEKYIRTDHEPGLIVLITKHTFTLKDVKVNTVITETYKSESKWNNRRNAWQRTPERHKSENVTIGIYECTGVKELEPVKLSIRELNERGFTI